MSRYHLCVHSRLKSLHESQTTYEKRDKSWTLLDHALTSLPRRNLLCVAGDFNTDLQQAPPYLGVSFASGEVLRRSARDQPRFQQRSQYLEAGGYLPRHTQGHSSRVDFVLTRLHRRRIQAHAQVASWRTAVGHMMLGGHIQLDVWRHAPATHASTGHDKTALCKACSPGPERDLLTFILLSLRRVRRGWQLPEVRSDLRRIWQLRQALQQTEVPRKSSGSAHRRRNPLKAAKAPDIPALRNVSLASRKQSRTPLAEKPCATPAIRSGRAAKAITPARKFHIKSKRRARHP